MESILGLSARYIPPATARAKLKHVTEDREKLDDEFKQKIGVRRYLYLIYNIINAKVTVCVFFTLKSLNRLGSNVKFGMGDSLRP